MERFLEKLDEDLRQSMKDFDDASKEHKKLIEEIAESAKNRNLGVPYPKYRKDEDGNLIKEDSDAPPTEE